MNLLLLIQSYGGFQFPSFTYLPLSWNVQVTHTHTQRIECRPAACILQNHALIFFPIEVFVRLRFPLIMTFDFGNLHIICFVGWHLEHSIFSFQKGFWNDTFLFWNSIKSFLNCSLKFSSVSIGIKRLIYLKVVIIKSKRSVFTLSNSMQTFRLNCIWKPVLFI